MLRCQPRLWIRACASRTGNLREENTRQLDFRFQRLMHQLELPVPCGKLPPYVIEPPHCKALLSRQRNGWLVLFRRASGQSRLLPTMAPISVAIVKSRNLRRSISDSSIFPRVRGINSSASLPPAHLPNDSVLWRSLPHSRARARSLVRDRGPRSQSKTASPTKPINAEKRVRPIETDAPVTQNAARVTQAASGFAFCVTDANYLLAAICAGR